MFYDFTIAILSRRLNTEKRGSETPKIAHQCGDRDDEREKNTPHGHEPANWIRSRFGPGSIQTRHSGNFWKDQQECLQNIQTAVSAPTLIYGRVSMDDMTPNRILIWIFDVAGFQRLGFSTALRPNCDSDSLHKCNTGYCCQLYNNGHPSTWSW